MTPFIFPAMRILRLLPLLCASLLFLPGCQNHASKLGEITVNVVNLRPAGGTIFESQAVLTLRFINENVMPFGIAGTTHKLFLNGQYVGKAVNDQAFGIPPLNTATREVTLLLENTALLRQVLALRGESAITYRLETVILTKEGDLTLKLPTRTEDRLDLKALQGLQ